MQKAPKGAFWRFLLRIHLQNKLDRFTEKRQTAFFGSARRRWQSNQKWRCEWKRLAACPVTGQVGIRAMRFLKAVFYAPLVNEEAPRACRDRRSHRSQGYSGCLCGALDCTSKYRCLQSRHPSCRWPESRRSTTLVFCPQCQLCETHVQNRPHWAFHIPHPPR